MPIPKPVQKKLKSEMKNIHLINVSNREPYIHRHKEGEIECKKPAGGLTNALDPVMRTVSGTWVAWGSGDADKETVDDNNEVKVPPENPKYTLKRVWITQKEVNNFYYGFANQTLWPLCHNVYRKPKFKKEFWETYKKLNKRYVENSLEAVKEGEEKNTIISFQDYHLALAGRISENKKPNIHTFLFWHIPWPHPDVFAYCPWKEEILEGMLGNDILGFQTDDYVDNFLKSANKILDAEIDLEKNEIIYKGHKTNVKPFPISVDYKDINKKSKTEGVKKEVDEINDEVPCKYIGVGVDRIDYTKGLPQKFNAIDRFLEKYPEYQEKFTYIQYGAPSRTKIPAYQEINKEIENTISEINEKYRTDHWKSAWKPIIYINEKVPFERVIASYKRADLSIVSSLKDGMNIVAKEYVSAQSDKNGVLILSPFAGAAKELEKALIVNPYNVEKFADTIKQALEMDEKRKEEKMKDLRKVVKKNDIYKWVEDIFTSILEVHSKKQK